MAPAQFGVLEDARRLVLEALADLSAARRTRAAGQILDELKRRQLLRSALEEHYTAKQVAELLHRCPEWAVKKAKAGAFGPCFRDDGGWLIPASGVNAWLARHVFSGSEAAPATSPAALQPQEVAA